MQTTYNINDKVVVNCPVYKNGKSHKGIIKTVSLDKDGYAIGYRVLIDGNVKSTHFWAGWVCKK